MSNLSLLHQDGHWLAFDGDRVTHLDARPKVDRATVVITDFDGSISQVTALEGSPSHAIALIEKRLRADGLIDNESKILIHQTKTVGNGYQSLFTAVPLDRWQQMFAWAEGQVDHCLLVPSVALLWQMLKPGRGIVLHSGRQFVFLASMRNRIVHVSALAFSESESDLEMTVAALAERAGKELAGADDALEALSVEWYGTLTAVPEATAAQAFHPVVAPLPSSNERFARISARHEDPTPRQAEKPTDAVTDVDDDAMTFDGQFDPVEGALAEDMPVEGCPTDSVPVEGTPAVDSFGHESAFVNPAPIHTGTSHRWLDETLLEVFSARSGTSVQLGPHTIVRDGQGRSYRSSVAHLAANASALTAVNPLASRLMYLAERLLPWASAASLVLALTLGGLGGRWTLAAHDASRRAEALDSEISAIDAEIAGLQQQQAMPESYPQLLKFIEHAGGLHAALDPHATLLAVREAAGDDVRILRLRLDPGAEGNSLRVDGMVKRQVGEDAQGMRVSRFVQRLRAAGYVPTAVDPLGGGSRAQSPGGSFSYQLKRAASTDTDIANQGDAS
ncbi:MAG TPA: hypothetical protein VLZ76_06075 [Lysobacter sp.]|nr:hypothetical protein [Lysobacter sp.]